MAFHHVDEVVDGVEGLEVFLIEVLFEVFDFAYFVFIKVLS